MLARPSDSFAWLRTNPSLDELRAAYPQEWMSIARADFEALRAMATAAVAKRRELVRSRSRQEEHALIAAEVRRQMIMAKLRHVEESIEKRAKSKLRALTLVPTWIGMQLRPRPR